MTSPPTENSPNPAPALFALIFWPSVITLVINLARCWLEVSGTLLTASGGSLQLLGISWLGLLFGGWFALRLRRAQGRRRGSSGLVALLAIGAIVLGIAIGFGSGLFIDREDSTPAAFGALRLVVITIAAIAWIGSIAVIRSWPRLGFALLVYAIPARLTVLALTYLAHQNGWDTHYTKFGPAGIEFEELAPTMVAATAAQLGFWVPWTVVTGVLVGSILARKSGGGHGDLASHPSTMDSPDGMSPPAT